MLSKIAAVAKGPNPFDGRADLETEYATSFGTQLYYLAKRTMKNSLRNPYLIRTQYILIALLGLCLGLIYWRLSNDLDGVQNRAGVLFFMISLLSFSSMSSIDIFFQERPIFLRERATGMYRTSSYFISKVFCDFIPMRMIPPLMLGAIPYYMVGLRPGAFHILYLLITLVLTNMVAASLCMMIGSFTPTLAFGNLLTIIIFLFFMVFGGFLVNKLSMPYFISWLQWSSFLGYAFEILMVNELDGLQVWLNPRGITIEPMLMDAIVFLEEFGLEPDRFYFDMVVLGGMSFFFLGFSYIFLRFYVKERR